MANIYQQSALTILAANTAGVENGFLGSRKDWMATAIRLPFLCRDGTYSTIGLSPEAPDTSYTVRDNPLEQRAWTCQERLLTPRALIYSHNGLRFVCRNLTDSFVRGNTWMQPSLSLGYIDFSQADEWMWRNVVREYSNRAMSESGDKLLAIAALAKVHSRSRAPQSDYLAGLWRNSIVIDLLWDSSYEKLTKDGSSHCAPSWSWASTDSNVSWSFTAEIASKRSTPEVAPNFEILNAWTLPKTGQDEYGQIDHACLKVRGHVSRWSRDQIEELGWGLLLPDQCFKIMKNRPIPLMPNPRILDGSQTRIDGQTWLYDHTTRSQFRMSFDSIWGGRRDIVLLLVLSKDADQYESGFKYCSGLVLEKLDGKTDHCFERAGTFEFRIDQTLQPSRMKPPAEQESSALRSPDYSCLSRLECSPIEDIVIVQ
ncbi:MAG: hypothetical protein M1822_006625 [Bathelium mastoideum]|nr:MAG: hypothetical protein M1822_006625 [Bathelium mastoideum]